MKTEQAVEGFWPRVILATFAACWFFGVASSLLAFGMGFENGYLTSDKEGVAERIWHGFIGGFVGFLGGWSGILAFVLVVKVVLWTTGIEIGDVSFFGHLQE
jgi:hypothetical protein